MGNSFFRKVVFGALLCVALSCSAQVVTLRFAYEGVEVFPYYMGNSSVVPEKPGVMPEVLRLLEKKIPNLKVHFQRVPWKRCLVMLANGDIDALESSFSSERLAYGVFPMKMGQLDRALRINTLAYSLYTLRKSPLNWDGQRLRGVTGPLGAPLGYSIVDDLRNRNLSVAESLSTLTDFQKMLLGRIAGVAAQEHVGDHLLRQPRFQDIVKRGPPLASKDYYLLLSRQFIDQHPQLAQRIWRTLADMRENDMPAVMLPYLE